MTRLLHGTAKKKLPTGSYSRLLSIRLMPKVWAGLRVYVRKRGDVNKLVLRALENANLVEIPLLRVDFSAGVEETSCRVSKKIYKRIDDIAAKRGCSMNILVNSAIAQLTLSTLDYNELLAQ